MLKRTCFLFIYFNYESIKELIMTDMRKEVKLILLLDKKNYTKRDENKQKELIFSAKENRFLICL